MLARTSERDGTRPLPINDFGSERVLDDAVRVMPASLAKALAPTTALLGAITAPVDFRSSSR